MTFPTVMDLETLDGGEGIRWDGLTAGGQAGTRVSRVGDINGDGLDDFVVTAPEFNRGVAYVVFGTFLGQGFQSNLQLDGTDGFTIVGPSSGGKFGISVSAAGDFDGDGFDDLIVGEWLSDPSGSSNAGASYIIYGKSNWASVFDIQTADTNSYLSIISTVAGAGSGYAVAGGGDVNGDGRDDVIIGAHSNNPGNLSGAGSAYVFFGANIAGTRNLNTLNGSNGFRIDGISAGDNLGFSVAMAGDVNGDNLEDFIVGVPLADPFSRTNAGISYVIFGQSTGWTGSFNLLGVNGTNGFRVDGVSLGDRLGWSVSSAGDINGDGFDDILLGAPTANPTSSDAGAVYVIFGKGSGWTASFDLTTLNGSNGFRITGVSNNDESGTSVQSAGDINGDGFGDLIIGAPYTNSAGADAGSAYVVFGRAAGWTADFALSSVNGTNGFRMDGALAGDLTGWSVAGVGDVDGDSFDDVLVGAPLADPAGLITNGGSAYLVFGQATGALTRTGTAGSEFLAGGDFNDNLSGLTGNDWLFGGAGDDTLTGGAGADTLEGGIGLDWASYFSATQRVVVFVDNPAASQGEAQGDSFLGVEFWNLTNLPTAGDTFFGAAASEFVFGQNGNDVLFGNGGNDALYGGGGDDFMLGGAGADTLLGDSGFDAVFYGDSATGITIDLANAAANTGFAQGDTFTSIEAFLLTEQGDVMRGADAGGAGDIMYGLGGADRLEGRDGFDYLLGGDGDDTLVGGFGYDLSTGGLGADRFVFNNGFEGGAFAGGGEVITDFQSGVDKIAFVSATSGFASFTLGANLLLQAVNGGGLNGTSSGPTLIYDSTGGALWFDSNGNQAGGLQYLASLLNAPVLTANDFIVI